MEHEQLEDEGQELDSQGKPAPFQPGDRVVTMQVPRRGQKYTIIYQYLHYDGCERFWGNCLISDAHGQKVHCHCWQLEREEGWEERVAAKEAAAAAVIEAKERSQLARLQAKYPEAA
jgi:hypothetical protein